MRGYWRWCLSSVPERGSQDWLGRIMAPKVKADGDWCVTHPPWSLQAARPHSCWSERQEHAGPQAPGAPSRQDYGVPRSLTAQCWLAVQLGLKKKNATF